MGQANSVGDKQAGVTRSRHDRQPLLVGRSRGSTQKLVLVLYRVTTSVETGSETEASCTEFTEPSTAELSTAESSAAELSAAESSAVILTSATESAAASATESAIASASACETSGACIERQRGHGAVNRENETLQRITV